MRNVNIQIQDKSGNWLTIHTLNSPNDIEIAKRLDEAVKFHPGKRVRATEQNGSIVDIR